MAVFLSASDETLGASHRSPFRRCGFFAPVDDWERLSEAWEIKVLAGPPRIPFLHMVDIRRPEWRAKFGLSQSDADSRVDAAFELIAATPSLTPVGMGLNSGHVYDTFTKKVGISSGAGKKFVPDYVAFPGYVYAVLQFCHLQRPDAERVDFYIEKNGEITDHLREFYDGLPTSFNYIGQPQLIPLLGDLIPAGKDRVPLQAADVLCWHTRRYSEGNLDAKGLKRYAEIASRIGPQWNLPDGYLDELWKGINEEEFDAEPGISKLQSGDEYDPPSRPKSGESCDGSGEEG